MMTTWLTQHERNHYDRVTDVDVNHWLQEARSIDKRIFLHEILMKKKPLFRKPFVEKYYHLYIDNGHEAQCFNFPPPYEGASSINATATKPQIMTWLMGYINGYECKRPRMEVVVGPRNEDC